MSPPRPPGRDRSISPKKAIEILAHLIDDAQALRDLPLDSPKRDEWTDTARGLLERAFESKSSIFQNFGRAQSIVFNSDTSDEEMLQKVNSILASTVAVLRSAIKQLSWEIEANEESPKKALGSTKMDPANALAMSGNPADQSSAPEPSALNILQQAIKAVPAVKYALGIAGIVSVIAIVKEFNLDFRIAILGTIIMFFLMIILVIFAKLATSTGSIFKWPILILTWFTLVITLASATLLFTSVFWRRPVDLQNWLQPTVTRVDVQGLVGRVDGNATINPGRDCTNVKITSPKGANNSDEARRYPVEMSFRVEFSPPECGPFVLFQYFQGSRNADFSRPESGMIIYLNNPGDTELKIKIMSFPHGEPGTYTDDIWVSARPTHVINEPAADGFQEAMLEARRIPGSVEVRVEWTNLPRQQNLFLMKSDGRRYYDPIPISGSSGWRNIVRDNSAIDRVAIVYSQEIHPDEFPNTGVEAGTPDIHIKIEQSISEQ